MSRSKILRRIGRLEHRLKILLRDSDEEGWEMGKTYHKGYDIGYIEGKISVLEDLLDTLEE